MNECQNCEREFEKAVYINGEPRCPYCMSGDVIIYEDDSIEEEENE